MGRKYNNNLPIRQRVLLWVCLHQDDSLHQQDEGVGGGGLLRHLLRQSGEGLGCLLIPTIPLKEKGEDNRITSSAWRMTSKGIENIRKHQTVHLPVMSCRDWRLAVHHFVVWKKINFKDDWVYTEPVNFIWTIRIFTIWVNSQILFLSEIRVIFTHTIQSIYKIPQDTYKYLEFSCCKWVIFSFKPSLSDS